MAHVMNTALRQWQMALLWVAVFALPALSLAFPSGYSWGALLLCLTGLMAWKDTRPPTAARTEWWAWGIVVASMGLLWASPALMDTPFHWNALDRPTKFALALVALPAGWCIHTRHAQALRMGVWAGVMAAALLATWQVQHEAMSRAWGHTNAIHFGNLALLLGLWSWIWSRHERAIWQGAGLLGLLAGVYTSILSESRGGWMVMPFLLAFVLWMGHARPLYTPPCKPRRHRIWVIMCLLVALLLGWQWKTLSARVQAAWQETQLHQTSGTSDTSVGQRLAHWKLAWQMGCDRPWSGWGETGYQEEKSRRIQQGQAPTILQNFGHAHNEWLDMWAKHGLFGVLLFGVFLGIPGWAYLKGWQRAATLTDAGQATLLAQASLSGAVLVLGYVGFGLTQVMFAHNSGTMVYLFMNLVLLGLVNATPASHTPRPGPTPG